MSHVGLQASRMSVKATDWQHTQPEKNGPKHDGIREDPRSRASWAQLRSPDIFILALDYCRNGTADFNRFQLDFSQRRSQRNQQSCYRETLLWHTVTTSWNVVSNLGWPNPISIYFQTSRISKHQTILRNSELSARPIIPDLLLLVSSVSSQHCPTSRHLSQEISTYLSVPSRCFCRHLVLLAWLWPGGMIKLINPVLRKNYIRIFMNILHSLTYSSIWFLVIIYIHIHILSPRASTILFGSLGGWVCSWTSLLWHERWPYGTDTQSFPVDFGSGLDYAVFQRVGLVFQFQHEALASELHSALTTAFASFW